MNDIIEFLKLVGTATDVSIISSDVQVKFKIKDETGNVQEGEPELPEKRKKFKDGVLTVYSRTVRFQEVMRYLIEDRRKLKAHLMKKTVQ